MAKSIFLVVFFAALVAVSIAQEQRFRYERCRREVQENPLYACRQIVHRQLTGRARVGAVPFQRDDRTRCCQELQYVSRECRCAVIRQMVRDHEQQIIAPLGGGYGGETGEQQQGYYGEHYPGERYGRTAQQQGGGYYGQTAGRQEGEDIYGERPQWPLGEGPYGEAVRRQWGEESYGYGESLEELQGGQTSEPQQQQQSTPPRLTKVRQYVAQLPTMCQMEPLECSVFSGDQY